MHKKIMVWVVLLLLTTIANPSETEIKPKVKPREETISLSQRQLIALKLSKLALRGLKIFAPSVLVGVVVYLLCSREFEKKLALTQERLDAKVDACGSAIKQQGEVVTRFAQQLCAVAVEKDELAPITAKFAELDETKAKLVRVTEELAQLQAALQAAEPAAPPATATMAHTASRATFSEQRAALKARSAAINGLRTGTQAP
jgi:hypothetical protein